MSARRRREIRSILTASGVAADTVETAAAIKAAGEDRRRAKAHLRIQMGGLTAAILSLDHAEKVKPRNDEANDKANGGLRKIAVHECAWEHEVGAIFFHAASPLNARSSVDIFQNNNVFRRFIEPIGHGLFMPASDKTHISLNCLRSRTGAAPAIAFDDQS